MAQQRQGIGMPRNKAMVQQGQGIGVPRNKAMAHRKLGIRRQTIYIQFYDIKNRQMQSENSMSNYLKSRS